MVNKPVNCCCYYDDCTESKNNKASFRCIDKVRSSTSTTLKSPNLVCL